MMTYTEYDTDRKNAPVECVSTKVITGGKGWEQRR